MPHAFTYDTEADANRAADRLRPQCRHDVVTRPDGKFVIARIENDEFVGFWACTVNQGRATFGYIQEVKP